MSEKFNWRDTAELPGAENFIGDYLLFDLGKDNHNLDSYFLVGYDNKPESNTLILFYLNGEDIEKHQSKFFVELDLDFDTAKNIVENTTEHFNFIDNYSFSDMKNYITQQIPEQKKIFVVENNISNEDEFSLFQDDDKGYDASNIHHFKNMDVRFDIESDKKNKAVLKFTRYPYPGESYDGKWYKYEVEGGVDNAKEILKDIIKHFDNVQNFDRNDIDLYLNTKSDIKTNNPHLEIAQKTGYVQGVCESVLAFNNDENRKIMTEATMNFLSKKLLSEMNVTKDMAQKFASPETYKALEKCVFTPKQEQKLEQTQSQGRGM